MKIKSFVQLAKEKAVNHTLHKYDKKTIIDTCKYPEYITISDAFVFFTVLYETSPQKKIISVLSIVGSIYELWRASILNGFTIRGAIEYGEVFYSENEVIGPSYMEAYRGETYEANTSRIICFPNVSEIIHENIKHLEYELQDYCKLWFKKDSEDWLILNPLTAFGIDNPEMVDQALALVKEMELGIDSEKIKMKYADLIKFLSDRRANYSDINIFEKRE